MSRSKISDIWDWYFGLRHRALFEASPDVQNAMAGRYGTPRNTCQSTAGIFCLGDAEETMELADPKRDVRPLQ